MNWVIFLPEIRYRKQSEDDIKSTIEETIHSPESRRRKKQIKKTLTRKTLTSTG